MSAEIYLEGGGDSREGKIRCREGFRKLLEKCDFTRRMPRLVACGGRDSAYDDFVQAHARARAAGTGYVGLLIDSEEPVANIDETWTHLRNRDHWETPTGAGNDQVLFMTTCMETWLVSDRATRNCPGPYAKGPMSFEVLGTLDPDTMARHLPSFARARGILATKLPQARQPAVRRRGRRIVVDE